MPPVVAMPLILSPVIYITGRWIAATARGLTLVAMGIIWIVFGLAAHDLAAANTSVLTYTQGMMSAHLDGLGLFIIAIVLFLGTLITIYSGPDIKGKQGEEKYYAMLLLLTGAIIGLVSAGDLFNLWLWFETTAISSYLLVAFYRDRSDALAACAGT
jgi:NADH:ubiquinone oxidoreductase subunit 5 (subunit L)/multisubunit Na+/H+ antiporter MnhA subunit